MWYAGGVRRGFGLLADAGFDGRDVEWTDVVPPIRRGGRLRAWSRVLRAEIVERVKASGLYGQRWKVETVISVIKRKFGDGVRRRRLRLARCEVLAKGVVYNLHRSFLVVVDVWCVWWALRGVSAVGLGIIATEHFYFLNSRYHRLPPREHIYQHRLRAINHYLPVLTP
jgi:hypothetical protein